MFETDFDDFVRRHGYEPLQPIRANTGSDWPRLMFNGEKRGRNSGRYSLTVDGDIAFGIFGSDKDTRGFMTWKSWEKDDLPPADIAAINKRMKKLEGERIEAEENRFAEVSRDLNKRYKDMPAPSSVFPYLKKKLINDPYMAKWDEAESCLVIPMLQEDYRVWSWQSIYKDGFKSFHEGGKAKGAFCPLSKPSDAWDVIYICEGWATGCSIKDATKSAVVVAFTANNLTSVAEIFRRKYPQSRIVIASDNDQFPSEKWPANKKWVNTGVTKGMDAAHKIGGQSRFPEFDEVYFAQKPTDWNDYAVIYGIDALREELGRIEPAKKQEAPKKEVKKAAQPEPPKKSVTSEIHDGNWNDYVMWKDGVNGLMDEKFSQHNAILFLQFNPMWKGAFVRDAFAHESRVVKALPWDREDFHWRSIEDTDLTQLRAFLSTNKMRIGGNREMKEIIDVVCKKQEMHPVVEYFDSLEWDGDERLDTWLEDYCNAKAESVDYLRSVGACFLKAAVKRVYHPGEKFDHMLVLEGRQAAGKSTLLKAICTFNGVSYFSDRVGFDDIGNKHLAAHMQGKLILEFAELTGLSTKDRNKIKGWITQTEDEIQPKFSNEVKVFPRQFVLAGSTNDSRWMTDPTGNRRFWPVSVGDIDIQGVEEVKEQLWAEAVYRVKSGEPHFITNNDPTYVAAEEEQAGRFNGHIWEDVIVEYLEGRDKITVGDILLDCLYITRDKWKNTHKAEVGDILRNIGWEYKVSRCPKTGKPMRMWVGKDE